MYSSPNVYCILIHQLSLSLSLSLTLYHEKAQTTKMKREQGSRERRNGNAIVDLTDSFPSKHSPVTGLLSAGLKQSVPTFFILILVGRAHSKWQNRSERSNHCKHIFKKTPVTILSLGKLTSLYRICRRGFIVHVPVNNGNTALSSIGINVRWSAWSLLTSYQWIPIQAPLTQRPNCYIAILYICGWHTSPAECSLAELVRGCPFDKGWIDHRDRRCSWTSGQFELYNKIEDWKNYVL